VPSLSENPTYILALLTVSKDTSTIVFTKSLDLVVDLITLFPSNACDLQQIKEKMKGVSSHLLFAHVMNTEHQDRLAAVSKLLLLLLSIKH
jgi:hypothetical protein